MPHDATSGATSTDWGSYASGGNITVNSVYELRDTLTRIASVVDLSPENDGGIRNAWSNGTAKIFELDNNGDFYYWAHGPAPSTNIASLYSNWNENFHGDWNSPNPMATDQHFAGDVIGQLFQRSRDLDVYSNTTVIGFDLNNVSASNFFGAEVNAQSEVSANGWESVSTIEDYNQQDVLVTLSDSFWDDVIEIDNATVALPTISYDTSFNGKTIDIDSLSGSNYKDLGDQINEQFVLNFTSNSPLYQAEFSGVHGRVHFINPSSGYRIAFETTDTDNSGWLNSSGIGAVDIDYDEYGNHIETEIEFGINDRYSWQIADILNNIGEAHEYSQSTSGIGSTSGTENSESVSTQLWEFESIDIWSNGGGATQLPQHDLNSLFGDAVAEQAPYFYTSYSGPIISDPFNPIKLEVLDFTSNVIDYQTQTAGFDLQLDGPMQSNALNKPLTRNYNARLNYQAIDTDAAIPIGELGSIEFNISEEYDGLGESHAQVWAHGLNNLSTNYPQYSDSSASIDYRLYEIQLWSHSDDGPHSEIRFERDPSFGEANYVRMNDSGHFTGLNIEDVFTDVDLIDTLKVENAFKPGIALPLSAQYEYFGEDAFNGNEALSFTYSLTTESDPYTTLSQNAVLGDSVDHSRKYNLDIFAESLAGDYRLESTDFTINFDPQLFENITESSVRIDGVMPAANAVSVDHQAGTIRIAAASLSDLTGYDHFTDTYDRDLGDGISSPGQKLASITLDFSESKIAGLEKNPDGSLVVSPLSFSITANQDETVFSKDFTDDDGLNNREIVTLNDLGGGIEVDGQEVTLYEAKINFEQLGDGLVLGTQRVIGADASFTNLIRSGDTITTSVDWLNVGNIDAHNLTYSALDNQNATLENAEFSQTSVASGSFKNGVFVEDARESTTLTTDIRIHGYAGNVVDLADGIVSIKAEGSDAFTNTAKGSSNLITFQGDLNYDGRVSMKDLAYLNAGAARQQSTTTDPTGLDADGNGIVDASVARDVDADFNGSIDMGDLAVLDADWGKSLHTGDQQFQGSADVSWSALDQQGNSSDWDNDSFKDQNSIEADSGYVGSLESPTAGNVYGADGDTSPNNNDMTGTYFQENI